MNDKKVASSSKLQSKKELIFQVYFPLSLFTLLLLAVSIMVIRVSGSDVTSVSHWSNISFVFISVPMFFSILLLLALLILFIFLQAKLIRWLPIFVSKIYVFFLKVALFIVNGSNKITTPIIKTKSSIYSFKSFWKNVRIKK